MKTMDLWKKVGVHNPYGLVRLYAEETGKIGVYLDLSLNDGSRFNMGNPDGWVVRRPGFNTDPGGGRWVSHGDKAFDRFAYNYNLDRAREAAIEWTHEKYGVGTEFVGITGFGRDRFPKDIAEWAKQKIKQIKKEAS